MKDAFVIFASFMAFAPCMLIVSESSTIVPNIIGFAYIAILHIFSRTKHGKRTFRTIYKSILRMNEKIIR